MPNKKIPIYKILLLGNYSVGKTCFLLRYMDNTFETDHLTTVGLDYRLVNLEYKSKPIKLQIWDTAGQDRFKSITKNYYKGANGMLILYDITNKKTFDDITNWITEINEESSNVIINCIGHKKDLENKRKVSYEEGKKLCDKYNMSFFECSAKTGEGVKEAVEDLVDRMIKNEILEKKGGISIGNGNKKGKCCI